MYGKLGMPTREKEYNRVHQFYRARSEHYFARMKKFQILGGVYRSENSLPLQSAFVVIASCINVYKSVFIDYPPYIAQ